MSTTPNYAVMPYDDYKDACDAVREKTGKSDSIKSGAFAAEIRSIESAAALYNAEEYTFGVADDPTEYALTNVPTPSRGAYETYYQGMKFTVLSPFSIKGFRMAITSSGSEKNFTPKLYRISDSELLASASVTCEYGATADVLLDIPVNLTVGETYAVVVKGYPVSYVSRNGITVNSKIGSVVGIATKSSTLSDILASNDTSSFYGVVFPIMGEPINADIPTEYKVQLTTMNDFAEEVQRITGATGKLSTAQIQSELEGVKLQEKTVTPSEEIQEVTPDDGYYGLSKVTVEGVTTGDSGSMFSSTASGVLPTVYKGTANSEFALDALDFQTSAVGVLSE